MGRVGLRCRSKVIEAVSRGWLTPNANHGGSFATSRESDKLLHNSHQAVADFLGTTIRDGCFART